MEEEVTRTPSEVVPCEGCGVSIKAPRWFCGSWCCHSCEYREKSNVLGGPPLTSFQESAT